MLSKQERIEKLNNAGINTDKYFTVDLDNGTKIHLIIDENGKCTQVKDPIVEQIIDDGYVRNTKLHRRFVMAQMFQMLNYVSYDGKYKGYNDYLKTRYGYNYTFKMMLEEVRILSKLETRDKETFEERSHFFTKDVVIAVMEDYLDKLKEYINKLPDKNCKGVPYKRIKGVNIFNDDLGKKIYSPIYNFIFEVKHAKNYAEIYRILSKCMNKKTMIKLPYKIPKSKVWIDAYKGEGAFYTLKNLVMFHDCYIKVDKFDLRTGTEAVKYLNEKLKEYKGEGWKMFALMKKVIDDNNFNFYERMEEIYNK